LKRCAYAHLAGASFVLDGQASAQLSIAVVFAKLHDVATEVKKEIELEIAHVLFIDIVGYSKLSANEQHARISELNEVVRLSDQFRKAEATNRILKIPTGDGIALVFYKSPEEPAQCAFEISRALKDNPRLLVRMGIHSGPVSGVVDVNERTNAAGGGINMAQRVMDCGDAGHILVSHQDAPVNIACVYAFCSDTDKAFEWLDKAVAYQDPGRSEIIAENLFDKIHSDPRWLPFLCKIGKAPDQLAKIEFKVPPLPR
jgi:class 3 adenylate cyclase